MQHYADIYLLQSQSTCFGVTAPIIRSTKNCNRSLRYRSYYRYSYFPATWPDQATLEGSSCTSIMTCTGGCGYSF